MKRRRLLVLKSMIKGEPVEMVTKSDAEYVTVRNGHKITNLSDVLGVIAKEINSLNSFKRSFGFTKKDYEAMDALKNMIEYMEDKENTGEIMTQLKKLNEQMEYLESIQNNFNRDLTTLSEQLTILQNDLKKKDEEDDGIEEPGDENDGSDNTDEPDDTTNPDETPDNPDNPDEGENGDNGDNGDNIGDTSPEPETPPVESTEESTETEEPPIEVEIPSSVIE